jgi:hypothetical protein
VIFQPDWPLGAIKRLRQNFSAMVSESRKPSIPLPVVPDLGTNTLEHIECLSKIFDYPRRSTQRFVEQLTFGPTGGQYWKRTLQIQLPSKGQPAGQAWRVVSLGPFRRRRFPDLVVHDASGTRINLLSRHQHGAILLGVLIAKHFGGLTSAVAHLQESSESPERETYNQLLGALYDRLTTVGDIQNLEREVDRLTSLYECVLGYFDPTLKSISERASAFRVNIKGMLEDTRYLCWVLAAPGEIINLQVSYTTIDPRRQPERRIDDEVVSKSSAAGRRDKFLSWYREFGLAPLKYSFLSHGHTNSYYLTLEPPSNTEVTHLDWAGGNSFEDYGNDLDSASHCAHLHYAHDSHPRSTGHSPIIWGYLRSMTYSHKQIAIGAALNLVLVFLVVKGGFSGVTNGSSQTWLLVTPTVLIAYIADQQRHYYAYATRRQRAILWLYLCINLSFLVAVSFHLASGSNGSELWNAAVIIAADILLVSSVLVCIWYMLLGYSFQSATRYFTMRSLSKRAQFRAHLQEYGVAAEKQSELLSRLRTSSEAYDIVVYRYCSFIVGFVVVLLIGITLVLALFWNFSPIQNTLQTSPIAAHMSRQTGTLTEKIWPSATCKECNVDFRFVPSAQAEQAK